MSLQFATIFSGLAAAVVPFTEIEAKYGLTGLLLAVFISLLCVVVNRSYKDKEALADRVHKLEEKLVTVLEGSVTEGSAAMMRIADTHDRIVSRMEFCPTHEEKERRARQQMRDSGDLPRIKGD